jgi:hypothetical protein
MGKTSNVQRQTYTKDKRQQSFGYNLALNETPDHMRTDLYDIETIYAKRQDLAVEDEYRRFASDPGTQHPRPTGDTKKIPSRLSKLR